MPAILIKVLKNLVWSFLGEKLLTEAAFSILKAVAKKTSNTLDDEIVAEAERRYKERPNGN